MTKPVVGCDLDDVLANFIKKFMDIAFDMYGVDPSLRPTSWEWDNADLTKDRINGIWQTITDTYNFWETLEVEPGASHDSVCLLNRESKLYFPTARAYSIGDDIGEQSARWLLNKFNIPFPTVFVSSEKGPLAAALKYDYFIDDRPKNCVEVKKAYPPCKVFLKNASHNQNIELAEIPRVLNFDEFAGIVTRGE